MVSKRQPPPEAVFLILRCEEPVSVVYFKNEDGTESRPVYQIFQFLEIDSTETEHVVWHKNCFIDFELYYIGKRTAAAGKD